MNSFVPRSLSPVAMSGSLLGRRALLKGMTAAAGIATVPGLGACATADPRNSATSTDTVRFSSSKESPRNAEAIDAIMRAFETESGIKPIVTQRPESFGPEALTSHLQGRPDDVMFWFAGARMRYYAKRGLLTDVSDIGDKVGSSYHPALREACTADDGKQYLRPFRYYIRAVFYRKSVWGKYGYTVPRTFDEYIALAARMKKDGLVPTTIPQRQGWPPLGTFDYLNLRLNGYAFHKNLLAGKEDWQGKRVRDVFDAWKRILPYQENAPDQRWEDAAKALQQGKVGMLLQPSCSLQVFNEDEVHDFDFFAFPELSPEHGQDTVEAPIDGLMVPMKAANPDGARRLLDYLATPKAQMTFLRSGPNYLAASDKVDEHAYIEIQMKQQELLSRARHVTQAFDRDTDQRFVDRVAKKAVIGFLNNPDDLDAILKELADQAKIILTDS